MSRRKGQFPIPAAGGHGKAHGLARPKLLDTSVIIDGRIAEICDTGIIEGEIIVPSFVLRELQHIADSSDGLKRNRGRRGLDILKGMQDKKSVPITVVSTDYKDVDEVDKEGKEAGQGIGYMDDGTMIVIENGRRLVGETVDVTVTSVLQTSAGRMIFARVKQA